MRLAETVVEVGTQGMQRQLPLQIPFAAGDFVSVQTPRYANLDALATEAKCAIYRFAHGAAECDALLKLQCNGLADKLGVELRLMYFLNIDEYFAVRLLREILLQLLNLGAFAADDDAGPRSANRDPQLVTRTVDFN